MKYGLLKEDYYQWDTGQRVELYPDDADSADELAQLQIHVFNDRIGGPALVMEVKTDERGILYANIPDLLFRLPGRIIFWRVISGEDGTSTVEEYDGINVIPRAKPTDYYYEDPDIPSYKELLEKFVALNKEYEEKLSESGDLKGESGKSAYQTAVENGFEGSEEEWLESLKGEPGAKGENGANGSDGISCTHSWDGTVLSVTSASGTSSADLKGEKGEKGEKGDPGIIDTAALKQEILNAVYPVGAIYISYASTSPATLFGGTWVQIQGQFLLAASSTYSAGSTGGEATHTLTIDELPSHNHTTKFFSSNDTWLGSARAAVKNDYWTRPTSYSTSNVSTESAGGGAAHNNMPPYLAVYMWRRTA
ncbi:MAG: phage tail protein [Eubacteriales bacterium]